MAIGVIGERKNRTRPGAWPKRSDSRWFKRRLNLESPAESSRAKNTISYISKAFQETGDSVDGSFHAGDALRCDIVLIERIDIECARCPSRM